MMRHSDGGNHHDEYKLWCLALWLVRDYPREVKRATPRLRMPDRDLRRIWLERYEGRHGRSQKLRDFMIKIHSTRRDGKDPEYTGPYQPASRPLPTEVLNDSV